MDVYLPDSPLHVSPLTTSYVSLVPRPLPTREKGPGDEANPTYNYMVIIIDFQVSERLHNCLTDYTVDYIIIKNTEK